eukprot:CAMPEP_0201240356 /NCGR_PEP_ID=MMETSP0852-20130820/29297_1 /ASSEMBLY_ACC=CAM_ASM_000632 /TAXON_ID=183588 /ORGANISM="Pseudo-nitzschia fraudulenta, Strain WWA7" /LENGTH=31 /DNA_ID= /DNA_START= /DNA_END= /DNA_ORIENTATION=
MSSEVLLLAFEGFPPDTSPLKGMNNQINQDR